MKPDENEGFTSIRILLQKCASGAKLSHQDVAELMTIDLLIRELAIMVGETETTKAWQRAAKKAEKIWNEHISEIKLKYEIKKPN